MSESISILKSELTVKLVWFYKNMYACIDHKILCMYAQTFFMGVVKSLKDTGQDEKHERTEGLYLLESHTIFCGDVYLGYKLSFFQVSGPVIG